MVEVNVYTYYHNTYTQTELSIKESDYPIGVLKIKNTAIHC